MRNMRWLPLTIVGSLLLLSGCATSTSVKNTQPWHYLPMAVPLQSTTQQEVQLARIDQILLRDDIAEQDRAQIYYERGLINDSLGLRDLARLDFNRSLSYNPAQPDVFNILGVYFTQSGLYDAAYEAFDSTLELNETHQYAERNRGIALYYGGRYDLAVRDLLKHYSDNENDSYRALWLYLAEREKEGSEQATQALRDRYQASDKQDWGWQLARLYLNDISEQAFFNEVMNSSMDNLQLAERLCEGYFYLAKRYQAQGDLGSAVALYKLAMAGNVYDFVEHRYSMLELSRIAQQLSQSPSS
ncbi:lipoprotein NlpI [Enterovibrio norvegicus FF-33]|uniref:Lipoprotein NlpI n=1 Tax=Enterovibrio norvegicus FF-454 TaxID=1185651 RepID=A0A1E5BWB4_9GAMM|nr:lipoprotein NlpI [Enterovibrio norvegicus]OEE57544.1 lipoprotein NlpI [Enterovibrio norvegicus FF-454]OEE69758.1 lipoprotein NlpI [Enterovibrio norvegicus FF-33]OEE85684.1 lipoprotein NlpI [Enterovibrio norvegicus FF-162]